MPGCRAHPLTGSEGPATLHSTEAAPVPGRGASRSHGHIGKVSVSLTAEVIADEGRRTTREAHPSGRPPRCKSASRSPIARVYCGDRRRRVRPPWDPARQFLLKLKTDSPCNPAAAPLGTRSREELFSQRNRPTAVYSGVIPSSPRLEAAQVPFGGSWLRNWHVVAAATTRHQPLRRLTPG